MYDTDTLLPSEIYQFKYSVYSIWLGCYIFSTDRSVVVHSSFFLLDCTALSCEDPMTNSPPGTTCLCVLPIKVELRLGIALYTFFALVSELAQEIASGVFMNQSQVHVMGANAATEDPEKTIVLIDLVPLGAKFDNTTTLSVFERFWHKQVIINPTDFGNYDVLYVQYPGESSL